MGHILDYFVVDMLGKFHSSFSPTGGAYSATLTTDEDGLLDGAEVFTHLTDPLSADTDGDGITDGVELSQGSDPTVPNTAVPTPTATPPTI
jgi:hypothetical protein